MSIHQSKLTIRITVVGTKNAGKTTLVRNYVGKYDGTNNKVNDAAYTHNAVVENMDVVLQILDSDGKNSAVLSWSHGVIIVVDVSNKESLKEAEKLIEHTKKITMKNATIMLVANKVDLPNREVLLEEGQKMATKYNCNYKELSAFNQSMINSVFYELSHEVIHKRGLWNRFQTPTMVRRVFQALTLTKKGRSYTSYI